ncbi:DUF1684 domain-containing protein [Microbacterium gorillae]|uniref:DUF1684 domain-containing protein n=1 Tax=Microbacterium gorillae TaxID=1231063 RepID=UPI000AFC2830|nr:DUF1684 domain-containing protein [Microbacterium gorillae]
MSIQQDEYDAFRRDREAEVTGPRGPLALVRTVWNRPDEEPLSDEAARDGLPADAVVTRLQRDDPETGRPQEGVRVWLADSPAASAFQGIDVYPYDERWVLPGRFELVAEDRLVPFEHMRDGGRVRTHGASGDVVFTIDGVEQRLVAFNADEDDVVQLVFADGTTGSESYPTGRFLYVTLPPQWRQLSAGESVPVEVDFTRAVIPPCGFSTQFNCPLPPLSNRLPAPVRAGEKLPVFAPGFELH